MMQHDYPCRLPRVLTDGQPAARALLRGGGATPDLRGEVLFYPFQEGSLLLVRVLGLPGDGFFALHIHNFGDCCEGGDMPFYCAGDHFNPTGAAHPGHAGDLPVLLSSGGRAFAVDYTGRFRPEEVLGRSVIIHEGPDDYRSQPSGGAGGRIACGIITPMA